MRNQVFISYRHESPEHGRAVRRMGELLRQAQIPVALDQFYLDEHPGGPDEGGWPKWCEDCANESACVVIVASEGWFAAYDKTGLPGIGLGAATEADLFRQNLWDEKGNNARIRLAFLHDILADRVPTRLRAWHQFRPFDSDDQLNQLVRWVAERLGLHGIEPPTVHWPESVPFEPDLADRTGEWPIIVQLLAGQLRERILLFEGGSGLGKSALVRHAAAYAKKLDIPVLRVDFKGGGLKLEGVLGQFDLDLGEHLPSFCREGASKTHLLRKDLRALRRPVLMVFDSYEDAAGNKTVADWLSLQLLAEVETALGMVVIVAGKKVPNFANAVWRDSSHHIPLTPITDPAHWEPWVEQRYPGFRDTGAHLPTALKLAGGNPGLFSIYCEILAKS